MCDDWMYKVQTQTHEKIDQALRAKASNMQIGYHSKYSISVGDNCPVNVLRRFVLSPTFARFLCCGGHHA